MLCIERERRILGKKDICKDCKYLEQSYGKKSCKLNWNKRHLNRCANCFFGIRR